MSLANVTHRRPRKSLLGTHKTKRESILPLLSDTLFSIYEEKKGSRDGSFLEETVSIKSVGKIVPTQESSVARDVNVIESSPIYAVADSPYHSESKETSVDGIINLVDSSAAVQDELSYYPEIKYESACNDRSPMRRRLDSLFSPSSKDDSFLIHETMLANDESVLATTLADVSSEANNYHSLTDHVTVEESVSPTTNQLEKNRLVSDNCDMLNEETWKTCDVVDKMLQFLDNKIHERHEFRNSCTKQIEEIQKKIDESNKELEDIKTMKQFLFSKCVPTRESKEKENVEPDAAVSSLSVRISSNNFVKELRSNVNCIKTPRQSRVSRTSNLLTPHTMSFCVKSQYENLLKQEQ